MRRSAFILAAAAMASGCATSGPERSFDLLDASEQPLRSRFDAARDKVRVLMLVSPT